MKMQEAQNAIIQMRFPQKLWYLLNLHTDAILWGGTGRTILLNYRVLQHYLQCDHSIFKTANISSFIRQLNLYGFRKVTSHFQDPLCNSSNPYMHEFIHDHFQYGRPELLNKITRKALTMKKGFKSKSLENSDHILYISPLQKARRALRLALKKAAQDLLVLDSSKVDSNSLYTDIPESPDDYCEDEENAEFDWHIQENDNKDPPVTTKPDTQNAIENNDTGYGEMFQDSIINFSGHIDTSHQNENFSSHFLSMPDLDNEPNNNSDIELLAEFNINSNIEQAIAKRTVSNESNSLNCVLPSINSQIDDVALSEKSTDMNLYNGEWDQMVYDIMNSRSSNQELSNFRELYSQISQTIDLLNS